MSGQPAQGGKCGHSSARFGLGAVSTTTEASVGADAVTGASRRTGGLRKPPRLAPGRSPGRDGRLENGRRCGPDPEERRSPPASRAGPLSRAGPASRTGLRSRAGPESRPGPASRGRGPSPGWRASGRALLPCGRSGPRGGLGAVPGRSSEVLLNGRGPGRLAPPGPLRRAFGCGLALTCASFDGRTSRRPCDDDTRAPIAPPSPHRNTLWWEWRAAPLGGFAPSESGPC